MDLVVEYYALCREFPKFETYSLVNQLQRAAISILSNEVETQLEIAMRLGYIEFTYLQALLRNADEIGKMLSGLQKGLKSRMSSSNL